MSQNANTTQRKTLPVSQSAVKIPRTTRPMPPWCVASNNQLVEHNIHTRSGHLAGRAKITEATANRGHSTCPTVTSLPTSIADLNRPQLTFNPDSYRKVKASPRLFQQKRMVVLIRVVLQRAVPYASISVIYNCQCPRQYQYHIVPISKWIFTLRMSYVWFSVTVCTQCTVQIKRPPFPGVYITHYAPLQRYA